MSADGGSRMERPVPSIDAGVSSYLDLTRLGAATVVFLSHLLPAQLGGGAIPGNDAVILFFVISGYVIAYTYERRDNAPGRYVINRIARLWSVLIPALILAGVAALVADDRIDLGFAPPIVEPGAFLSASLRTAFFLGEGWAWRTPAPFNDPTWSLNYEAWYYAIFAAFVFAPRSVRWPAAAFAALLAGPAIVALLPCWLVGVVLYVQRRRLSIPAPAAYALFAASLLGYAAAYHFHLSIHSRQWLSALTGGESWRLHTSTAMIGDFALACLFGSTIVAVGSMPHVNRGLARIGGLTRAAASRTLSIYLYHMPIMAILVGLGFGRGSAGSVLTIALDLGLCLLLGSVTETKLNNWRTALWRAYRALRPTPA